MTGNRSWRSALGSGASWRSSRVLIAALTAVAAIAATVIVAAHLGGGSPSAALPASGGHSSAGSPTPGQASTPASAGHSGSQAPSGSPSGRSRTSAPGGSHSPGGSSSPSPKRTSPSPAPSSGGPIPSSPLVPTHGALFGAYAAPGGDSFGSFVGAIVNLEHDIGRKLAIDNLYDRWGHKLPLNIARWDLRRGTIPMISWAGAPTNLVTSGAYDSLIRASARQLRSLHGPVMLRWLYEMDGVRQSSLVRSPGSFVAAWRHIHHIFVTVGATNVSWVWCPNAFNFGTGISQRYYPGSRYVNWICADGYNWAPKQHHATWNSFAHIFSAFYHWGTATGKPLMVGEFGVLEAGPGKKAAWYRQADHQLRTMFPAIRAVVYFNSDHEGFNWRITTSASALAAFRAFATDPYFGALPKV